jgi:hypothetical protein
MNRATNRNGTRRLTRVSERTWGGTHCTFVRSRDVSNGVVETEPKYSSAGDVSVRNLTSDIFELNSTFAPIVLEVADPFPPPPYGAIAQVREQLVSILRIGSRFLNTHLMLTRLPSRVLPLQQKQTPLRLPHIDPKKISKTIYRVRAWLQHVTNMRRVCGS